MSGSQFVNRSAQEHLMYIQEKVNPVLEALVTAVLLERPDDPSFFMLRWLMEQTKTVDGTDQGSSSSGQRSGSTAEEIEAVRIEIKKLEERKTELLDVLGAGDEGKASKASGQDAKSVASTKADDNASEEEEDDDMEIEFVEPPKGINRGNRQSVSAEAYGAWNKKAEFNAPVYEKTSEQKARIERCLEPSFLFQGLEKQDMQTVILAFKEKNAEADERIIQEGDDGESMYLIEEGVAECFKKIDGTDLCVKTCSPGDVFGELALLYNCPRAASVVCKEKCILWELDRETFNNIVKEAAAKKRDTYTDFLKKVPLFANVDQYEIMTMADACKEQNFQGEDTVIIKQGDSGDKFYVVVEGECIAKKAFVSGQEPQKVMTHKVGDYFGELALISNTLRAASVHAATPEVKLLSMERRTFTRLLGSMKEILQREGKRYEIADSSHK
mmetsp:Transcript_34193/g.55004  ORF Transcript_34193/g.55004 Transcript_34193/m.55004 type:complete len:443 (+) Transcript_34193:96-1424(+)